MGRETGYSMTEARHGVMLLGEEFGVHLPRSLTTFIASLGPIGSAMEAAFPFLAIVVGATLLLEHLAKLREEGQKLTASQTAFGTTVANVLNGLNDKLLEAGIRSDELRGDHLSALNKQLELIDHQSLKELVESFNTVAKAADVTFAELSTKWYQFGVGSAGAKAALDEFRQKYDLLIAQGKDKDASDLLAGTKQSAEHVLELMKQAKDNQTTTGTAGTHQGDYAKFEAAKNELKQQGIGYTQKEIEAQETLVGALEAQVQVQQKVNELKAAQQSNAKTSTGNQMAEESDRAAREQMQNERKAAEDEQKLWEQHYREAVAQLQESERLKIDETQKGSMARLQAIDQAIKEEESKGLQETEFFKSLLQQRVNLQTEMQNEQGKLAASAGKESAENAFRMGQLQIEAEREAGQSRMAQALMNANDRAAMERKLADQELQIEQDKLNKERAALQQSDAELSLKQQQIDDKEEQLEKQHQNRLQQIRDQAAAQEYARLTTDQQRMANMYATGFAKVIMGKESFGKMMQQVDSQVASGMIRNAIMSMLALDMTKEREAAAAARKGYLSGISLPPPANMFIAPAFAAAAFASVMAFEEGGIVPGVGKGDIQPAMLEPGEGILTKGQMEALSKSLARGESGGSSAQEIHVHQHFHNSVQALDSDGFDKVLTKHADTLEKHFTNHLRRMNK
jgi:hypothetical protein